MTRWKTLSALGPLLLAAAPPAAYAHGFGERYDLPVPLTLYIIGAGSAVALSFVVIALFARGVPASDYPRFNLLRWRLGRALADWRLLFVVKLASVVVFITALVAGFAGSQEPNSNLAPTLVWIIFWVGVAYVNGLIGNLWALINPWKILFGWAETIWRSGTGRPLSLGAEYPPQLGVWPAVALFAVFAWAEIAWPNSGIPSSIAALALAYTGVTFAGMFIYGRDIWLERGEALSVAMAFFARLAPTEVRAPAPNKEAQPEEQTLAPTEVRAPAPNKEAQPEEQTLAPTEVRAPAPNKEAQPEEQTVDDYPAFASAPAHRREWNLRPWSAGLLVGEPLSLSASVFLILMLSTVSFDGFAETPIWAAFLADSYSAFSWLGVHAFTGVKTFGLLLTPAVLLAAFALAALAMRRLGESEEPIARVIGRFAVSLTPIALAYHIAHFLSFLLIQGQRIIPLASDPFGRGWNLFGTAGYEVAIDVVNARFAWIAGVAAIVVGHVAAVYAAHIIAGRAFSSPSLALRSQLPMMALMTGYTMLSLWIVAQPIVAH